MKYKDWLEHLFLDEEYVAAGNQYAVQPKKVFTIKYRSIIPEFTTLNPIKEHRLDANVTRMQNFLFELDDMPLDRQKALIPYLQQYVTSIVYSGGKSLHFIVKLDEELEELYTEDGDRSTFYTIKYYKKVWQEIGSALSELTSEIVDKLNFDPSCKNPSRLTRSGGAQRRENGQMQSILHLGESVPYSAFEELGSIPLSELREQAKQRQEREAFNGETTTMNAFTHIAPSSLLFKLKDKSWASAANMYPELFKLTVWAIESTGVSEDIMIEYLEENTFPNLIEVGYPQEKLMIPIKDAYQYMLEKE